jgi:hypothetical protein
LVSGNWRITFNRRHNYRSDPGGLPLMSEAVTKAGTRSCRPGEFIREATLREPKVPVAGAAEILGVGRTPLSDLVNGQAARTSHDGTMTWNHDHSWRERRGRNGAEAGIPPRAFSARANRSAPPASGEGTT